MKSDFANEETAPSGLSSISACDAAWAWEPASTWRSL